MKGRLELIGDWWYVRYTTYDGGGSFRLLVHPNFVDMTDFVIIKDKRFYDGDEVEFTQVLVNPMGREVDPNDLGQNHSKCKWYAKPSLVLTEEDIFNQKDIDAVTDYINKEQQKQHLIDMMESDEELGLYDETIDSIKLEEVFGSKHCLYSVIENKLAILYRNQEKILSAIKILNNGRK